MNIWANHIDHLTQSCGITELGIFRKESIYTWSNDPKRIRDLNLKDVGAGFALASFTDLFSFEEIYQEAYEELKKKYKIVYQSPVRVNRRTGRKFFFCIYDTTRKGN